MNGMVTGGACGAPKQITDIEFIMNMLSDLQDAAGEVRERASSLKIAPVTPTAECEKISCEPGDASGRITAKIRCILGIVSDARDSLRAFI